MRHRVGPREAVESTCTVLYGQVLRKLYPRYYYGAGWVVAYHRSCCLPPSSPLVYADVPPDRTRTAPDSDRRAGARSSVTRVPGRQAGKQASRQAARRVRWTRFRGKPDESSLILIDDGGPAFRLDLRLTGRPPRSAWFRPLTSRGIPYLGRRSPRSTCSAG